VTFDSITGVITVSAVIEGVTVTHTLTTGTSWEIGDSVKQMRAELIEDYQSQILGLIQSMAPGATIGPNGPGPGPGTNPNPVTPPVSAPGGTGNSS
jgi:hypothetical protein